MQVSSTRLQHFLRLYRVSYSLIQHAPVFSSQMAAAAMHIPGKEMAKTVVLEGRAQSYLVVLPASYHVDLYRMGEIVGEAVHLAPEDKIRELFPDCELGAIPPFGRLYGVPVYMDVALAIGREIVFPAGSHSDALRMNYQDFEDLARPEICSFAVKDTGLHPVAARKKGGNTHEQGTSGD
jgi:Ala-tRNA(Pro) deacylase